MSQRQGEGGICTKNGSYCEKEKKSGGGVGLRGGGGQGGCEAFVKIQTKKFFLGGGRVGGVGLGGGGGGGGFRVDVNGKVELL